MIHLYIGNGKGKTSAALGLCLRAAGFGKKIYIAQFLKSERVKSGEVQAIRTRLKKNVIIERFKNQEHPFFRRNKPFNKKLFQSSLREAVDKVQRIIISGTYEVVVLDEILDAVRQKFIDEVSLIRIIRNAKGIDLVLTGRAASAELRGYADYISSIKNLKHPFQQGLPARRGIEY